MYFVFHLKATCRPDPAAFIPLCQPIGIQPIAVDVNKCVKALRSTFYLDPFFKSVLQLCISHLF